jgi:hypothetical protein
MSDWYMLDEHHNPKPCNYLQYAEWFFANGEETARRIASDTIGDVYVSTVFLGRDHRFAPGMPILFETMVFGGVLDQEQCRYCAWNEAVVGHANMIERVRAAQ